MKTLFFGQTDSSGIFHHGGTKMFEGLKAGVGSKSTGDDRHQAGNKAGDESKGISDDVSDLHQTGKYKAGGAGLDGVFEAGGAGLDFVYEAGGVGLDDVEDDEDHQTKTKANGGDLHQTKGNGGNLHQAKTGTRGNTKAKIKTETEDSKNLQAETRTGGKGRGRR